MRLAALAAAALLLTGFALPQDKDWRTTVATAPTGAMIVGNPAARTKLVEYLSYTCSHCATFVADSKPELKDRLVRSGAVSIEYRPAVRDALDLSAAIGTRCAGPARFVAAQEAVFANQAALMAKAQALPAATGTQGERLKALADGSGLSAILNANGVPQGKLDQCLADPAALKTVLGLTETARGRIQGTPSFEVNGEVLADVHDWGSLAPRLRTAAQ